MITALETAGIDSADDPVESEPEADQREAGADPGLIVRSAAVRLRSLASSLVRLAIEGERVSCWNEMLKPLALGLHEHHLQFVFATQEDVSKVRITATTPSWNRFWLEDGGGVDDIGRHLKLQAHWALGCRGP